MEKLLELKEKDRDYHEWNQLLRKRHRDKRALALKEEEESKRPKNFGLSLVDRAVVDEDHLRKVKQAQSMQAYRKNKLDARDQIRQ